MKNISRRHFLQGSVGVLFAALLAACTDPEHGGPPSASPDQLDSGSGRPILQNDDRRGFYIRYFKPFPAVDPERWQLSLEGKLRNPLVMTLADIRSLSSVSQLSRMRCVEGWSAPAKWLGFSFRTLFDLIQPREEAQWAHFYCADGYEESLQADELLKDRVLLVYGMNEAALPDIHGAPLRLIAPEKLGYKNPKVITRIVFNSYADRGTWPRTGRFSADGNIESGLDVPLDLGVVRVISGGEIKYPDGLESQSN